MAKQKKLEYGFANKAWQVVTGCDNTISCWRACWAKRTVARLAGSPNAKTAAAHVGLVQMSGPTKEILTWTGDVRINEAHLNDPLKWRKAAIIATGFHGDWGLLSDADKDRMFAVMAQCPQHTFFPLMKHRVYGMSEYLACRADFRFRGPLPNVNIGVSVMTQADATAALPHVRAIAAMGWKTHCWHEPAIGPVDWRGWEFLTWLVVGGQSAGTEPFDVQWARNAIAWGRANGVPVKIKQLGSLPVIAACRQNHFDWGEDIRKGHVTRFSDYAPELWRINLKDHRGSNPSEWPEDLRVRQMPEARGVRKSK